VVSRIGDTARLPFTRGVLSDRAGFFPCRCFAASAPDSHRPATELHTSPFAVKQLNKEEQTQGEMNGEACAGLKKAEAAMQRAIDRVLSENRDDANFAKAFGAAQVRGSLFAEPT